MILSFFVPMTVVYSALMGYQIVITLLEDVTTDTDGNDLTSATLYWSAPLARVNGWAMDFTEIGGYEIRYKRPSDSEYSNVVISDASVEQYTFDSLENVKSYVFEMAIFDVNGIYSDFVAAN